MSNLAWRQNCLGCGHFKRRHEGALDAPNCPCPRDKFGALIRPERVKRSMPVGWECPKRAKGGAE